MATNTEVDVYGSEDPDEVLSYRALSAMAVVSLVVGVASAMTIPTALVSIEGCLIVCPLPIVGMILGIKSWRKIRRQPEELTGALLASAGTVMSFCFLVGGFSLAVYVYATEVPDGYQRISFSQMRPDDREMARSVAVPEDILQYHGKKVFIKGYMRPSAQRFQLDQFLLVRDNNQCCFGDLAKVKYYDQVQVFMAPGKPRADYSRRIFRMGGTLMIDPAAVNPAAGRPVFTLLADYLN